MAPIEGKWIAAFVEVLQRCGVRPGDACAVLAESQSRPVLPQLAALALHQLGASHFLVTVPTPALAAPVPVRSTGASSALRGQPAVVQALARCALVVDCTVEGLQHAAELAPILAGGARVLVVSNEHPEILERCLPQAQDEAQARDAMRGSFAASGDRAASAVSHVGWGLNRRARWDAMTYYDKRDFNGTELRACAGNFLYSTGANEVTGRHTAGHFDLPLRSCTVELDGRAVVRGGVLL